MKRKSIYLKVTATLLSTSLLFACSKDTDSTSGTTAKAQVQTENLSTIGNQDISTVISNIVTYDEADLYTDWENANPTYIKLNGTDASVDGSGAVMVNGGKITIRSSGVYVIRGILNDGQVVINAEDKGNVRLVLNGVQMNSTNTAPIYVEKAEKTIISLPEGTENLISDGQQYVYEDSSSDEPNAAIFSKDDLTINGTGKLTVQGNYNNGITSKDELRITGGNIDIHALDDGLMGRDVVAVKDGTISIEAGGDGIKSSNDKDTTKGNIALEGGTFTITAEKDGIQAETNLLIADGNYTISSGGGSPETIASRGNEMGGRFNTTTVTTTTTETESTKGLKAAVEVAIGGGTFNIDSLDDAIHSNNSVTISGGEISIATGDDGIHGDASVLTKGGNIHITKSYEGIESQVITIADGDIHLVSSDDGINVGGGNDGSGMDMQSSNTEDNILSINGGYVVVNAEGDGLDANGSIYMTDGTVLVNGPTNDGNGSLDYDGSFEMSGGFLIAAGSSGMAQAATDGSTQNSILMTYPQTQAAGTIVHLEDSKGNTVAAFAPEKEYQSVFISSPEISKDSSYTLYSGGTSAGKETDGLYTEGDYEEGTKLVEFTISESVTWLNESGVTEARSGGPMGGGPRGGGQRPDGNQAPPANGERP